MTGAADIVVSEARLGAEPQLESELPPGATTRYIDASTELLGQLASMWMDFQQMRKAAAQRGLTDKDVAVLLKVETHFGDQLKKALRQHVLWDGFLSELSGLGGVHTARLIARIGDPRRFPGQQCTMGHTFVPTNRLGSCPFQAVDGEHCPGIVQEPRRGTGTRSVWHYLGLHVVNGRSPRKQKGQQADWDPLGRTAVLQPDGIADAIVRNRVPRYRDIYDDSKARLIRERGADSRSEVDALPGPDAPDHTRAEAESPYEIEPTHGLRPFESDRIARKIAAKAFVGDLLQEWKRRADTPDVSDFEPGPASAPAEAAA